LTDCRSGSTSRESRRLSGGGGGGSSRAVLFNNALRAGRGALEVWTVTSRTGRAARPPCVDQSLLRGGDDDDDDVN